jgi:hypothetical protein
MSSGPTYKRNQIERAVGLIAGRREPSGEAALEIRNDLKRLLDIDRNPRAARLDWSHPHHAFYDGPPPGRGAEIGYSRYHAFALLAGWRLLQGGLPQSTVVKFLREVRRELEPAHEAILALDPARLRPELAAAERERRLADGVIVHEAGRMRFLVLEGALKGEPIHVPTRDDGGGTGNVCADAATLLERMRASSHLGRALTVLEIVNPALQLAVLLERVPVRKRGPAAR